MISVVKGRGGEEMKRDERQGFVWLGDCVYGYLYRGLIAILGLGGTQNWDAANGVIDW